MGPGGCQHAARPHRTAAPGPPARPERLHRQLGACCSCETAGSAPRTCTWPDLEDAEPLTISPFLSAAQGCGETMRRTPGRPGGQAEGWGPGPRRPGRQGWGQRPGRQRRGGPPTGHRAPMEGHSPCDLLSLGGRDVGDQMADIGTGRHGRCVAHGGTPPKPYPPNGGMLWGYFGFLKISYVGVSLSYLSCMSLIVTLCSHTRDTSRAQRGTGSLRIYPQWLHKGYRMGTGPLKWLHKGYSG